MYGGHLKHKRFHEIFFIIIRWVASPFIRLKCAFKFDVIPSEAGKPVIVVCNHVTDLDPALVGIAFKGHLYFVASEHVTRWGLASRLLQFFFAPIIRVKGKTDARVGMDVIRKVRKGSNVCIFAEGNRSFNGLTGPVFPATGKLVRSSGAGMVTFRLEGGYFTAPRWARKMRRGRMYGRLVGSYSAADIKAMSSDEINDIISRDIHEDAYERQRKNPIHYRGPALAEDIQTGLYLCPKCGQAGTLTSSGSRFSCACGLAGTYDELGMLTGQGFSFSTVTQWDAWQATQTQQLVSAAPQDGPICGCDGLQLYTVQSGVKATPAGTGRLALYTDRLVCGEHSFLLQQLSDLAIVSQRTLTFSTLDGRQFEIKSRVPYSALMFKRIYDFLTDKAHKNIETE